MQPKTSVKFDQESFKRIKRTIRNMSIGKNKLKKNPSFAMELPDEIGLQLTNKCNLRCKHCFQWNKEGFFNKWDKETQNKEINFEIVEKILKETFEIKSNLYLWGGEPLSYSKWNELSIALEKDPRWTVFCTNGIDIQKQIDSLNRISLNLAMLISVEGFEKEHDAVRGRGTYKKVINNIDLLLKLKKKKIFHGAISVNCVISENMIGKLYDLAIMFESMGINTLYFCFPWYISENTAKNMDNFFKKNFKWLRKLDKNHIASWHSYKYSLNPDIVDKLIDDLERINSKIWKIRMRYQPALQFNEIKSFINGPSIPAQKKSKCIGLSNRMNVMPDGKVTVCKLFPEFEIGDLNKNSVKKVWTGEKFKKARRILNGGLTPVCSKCILLYLHGV